jgi:hypothetical protein
MSMSTVGVLCREVCYWRGMCGAGSRVVEFMYAPSGAVPRRANYTKVVQSTDLRSCGCGFIRVRRAFGLQCCVIVESCGMASLGGDESDFLYTSERL